MTGAIVVGGLLVALFAILFRARAGRRLGGSTHDQFWDFDE